MEVEDKDGSGGGGRPHQSSTRHFQTRKHLGQSTKDEDWCEDRRPKRVTLVTR